MSQHKLFEAQSDIGLLTIQITAFTHYIWIIITESKRLQIDGSIQIGTITPYSENKKATVINIAMDEHQAEKEYEELCRIVSSQLNCFVVLSINTNEMLSIGDLRKIGETLKVLGKQMIEERNRNKGEHLQEVNQKMQEMKL